MDKLHKYIVVILIEPLPGKTDLHPVYCGYQFVFDGLPILALHTGKEGATGRVIGNWPRLFGEERKLYYLATSGFLFFLYPVGQVIAQTSKGKR
jgi:hypothetical protein